MVQAAKLYVLRCRILYFCSPVGEVEWITSPLARNTGLLPSLAPAWVWAEDPGCGCVSTSFHPKRRLRQLPGVEICAPRICLGSTGNRFAFPELRHLSFSLFLKFLFCIGM